MCRVSRSPAFRPVARRCIIKRERGGSPSVRICMCLPGDAGVLPAVSRGHRNATPMRPRRSQPSVRLEENSPTNGRRGRGLGCGRAHIAFEVCSRGVLPHPHLYPGIRYTDAQNFQYSICDYGRSITKTTHTHTNNRPPLLTSVFIRIFAARANKAAHIIANIYAVGIVVGIVVVVDAGNKT